MRIAISHSYDKYTSPYLPFVQLDKYAYSPCCSIRHLCSSPLSPIPGINRYPVAITIASPQHKRVRKAMLPEFLTT
jgi:hypothetical protein